MADQRRTENDCQTVVVRLPLTVAQEQWLRMLAQFEGVSLGEMISRAWKDSHG